MTTPSVEIRVRLDETGRGGVSIREPLDFVSGQKIVLDVVVEKLDINVSPPAYGAVDLTGMDSEFIAKADIDDDDSGTLWEVSGVAVGSPTLGIHRFTVDDSLVSGVGQYMYGEIDFLVSSTPVMKWPFTFSLTKPALTT